MELIDVLDENGTETGKVLSRKEVHANGIWHKASGVLIINSKNEILLQLRSKQKEKNGGLWDMSASGHIPSGETPEKSLVREIKEEIGVGVLPSQLKPLGGGGIYKRQEVHNNGKFIENEYDYVYVLEKDIDVSTIKLQEEEVEDVKFVPVEELAMLLENGKVVKRLGVWDDVINHVRNKKNK